MFDNFENYYYENIIVPYYEYMEQKNTNLYGRSRDLKLAIICASNLFHLREHLPIEKSLSYNEVVNLCPEYKLIADISNVSKHNIIDRNEPKISKAKQITEKVIYIKYTDNDGDYTYTDKVICVKLNNGKEFFLHLLLYKIIKFWNNYLFKEKLIFKEYRFRKPKEKIFRTRDECKGMDIEMLKGYDFDMSMQFLKFNNQTKTIEPVDLTDTTINLRVFKPKPLEVDVKLVNHKTCKKVQGSIALTIEDTQTYEKLKTEQERREFVQNLQYVRNYCQYLFELTPFDVDDR